MGMHARRGLGIVLPERNRVGHPQLGILAGLARGMHGPKLQVSPGIQKGFCDGQQSKRNADSSDESEGVEAEPVQEQQRSVATPEDLRAAIDRQQAEVVIDILKEARSNGSRFTCAIRVKELISATDDDGNTMLHRCVMSQPTQSLDAAEKGTNQEIAELLLSSKASVNSVNLMGETPLLMALRSSVPHSLVQVLLEARADVGLADNLTGETALMEVSIIGDAHLCCLLLEWEADPLQRNHAGCTAWDIATSAGNDQIAALMPEAAVEPPAPPEEPTVDQQPRALRSAIRAADHAAVLAILEDLDANSSDILRETDGSGRTSLHVCAELPPSSSAADLAQCLVEHSACPNAKDAFGQTALEIAVSKSCEGCAVESLGVVRLLLESRADASVIEAWQDEHCALRRAVSASVIGVDLCQLLLTFGACLPWFEAAPTHAETSAPVADSCVAEDVPVRIDAEGEEVQSAHEVPSTDCPQPMDQEAGAEDQAAPQESSTTSTEAAVAEFQPPMRAARNAGLKSRCEEHGIPLDALGRFGATDLLRDLDRLQSLDLEALRNEAREKNLHAERCYDKEELISRLKQARIWKLMPLALLQAECREKAAQVVADMQRESGVALAREDLQEAMAVATWGGSTRTQVVHELCQAKGIPIDRLPDLDVAAKLLEEIQDLEEKSTADLMSEYKLRGFAPGAGWQKADLLANLQTSLTWEVLPLSELRQVCKQRSLPAKGDHRRADLLQLLAAASWEDRGVPVHRLPNLHVASGLLDQVERLEQLSLEELIEECTKNKIHVESKPSQQDLLKRLKDFYVWSELPIKELRKDLQAQGVAISPSEAETDASTELRGLKLKMVGHLICANILESKGIPARRVSDVDEALKSSRWIDDLENLSLSTVRLSYEALDMPSETRLIKQQLLERMRQVVCWDFFTTEELLKECETCGIQTARCKETMREVKLREELQKRLRKRLCMESWKACGMPTDRLGTYEQTVKVVQEFERLVTLTPGGLGAEYGLLGLDADLPRDKLMERLQVVAVWRNLPFQELRKECREFKVSVPLVPPGDAVQRGLVAKLARAVWDPQTTGSQGQQPNASRVPPPPSATGRQSGMPKKLAPPKTLKAFETLHLPPSSTANDVRKAFRQLALQYHPDKNPGQLKEQAESKFREVNDAYKELCSYLQMT